MRVMGSVGAFLSCLLVKLLSEGCQSFPRSVCVRLCPKRAGRLSRGEFGRLWVTHEDGGGISMDLPYRVVFPWRS